MAIFQILCFALHFFLPRTAAQGPAPGQSGAGTSTRYWDCCKPSCAWPAVPKQGIVGVCDANDQPLQDPNAESGCQGGPAFMCSSQSPWAINDNLAYGFAAVSASNPHCCECWKLTFSEGPAKGKQMIVQATNTGTDVKATAFDIAMPGGGYGMFDGCSSSWGATPDLWGQQWGGMSSNKCSGMPKALQAGCNFRWDWMKGADNPAVTYESVGCPAELVAKSGCGTADDQKPQGLTSSNPLGDESSGVSLTNETAAGNAGGAGGAGGTRNASAAPVASSGTTGATNAGASAGAGNPDSAPATGSRGTENAGEAAPSGRSGITNLADGSTGDGSAGGTPLPNGGGGKPFVSFKAQDPGNRNCKKRKGKKRRAARAA